MATSGTVSYTQNRNEIIRSAYEIIGVATDGEALNGDDIDVAQAALNVMIKAWIAHGLQLWKRNTKSITLTAATSTYTLGTGGTVASSIRPLRIIECDRLDSSGIEVPMTKLSLSGYSDLPNKSSTGIPVNYFYDPTLTVGTLTVWPVPDATIAAEYTIEITYQSPMEDLTSGTDNVDFPQYWEEAIIYGLAERLAPRSALDLNERVLLKQEAKASLDLAMSFDVEDDSIYFQPKVSY